IKWSDREVMVTLHGERVQGRHVLFRTGERQWMIHRMDPPQDPGFEPLPAGWTPMHARRGELPDDVAGWSFEIAWPGARVLAAVDGGRPRLTADGGDPGDVTDRFPEVRPLGRALGARPALLDGVIVALGEDGRPRRDLVARRMEGAGRPPVVLMLVDVLHLDGHPLTARPYRERRDALETLALAGPAWQTPAAHAGAGTAPVWPDGSCDPDAGKQAERCLQIIDTALAEAGASLYDVVRTRMFLVDAGDGDAVGRAHAQVFGGVRPVATMVVVAALLDARWRVEIEAEAVVSRD